MPRQIAFLIYPDFQLDAAGPIAAFEIAAHHVPGSSSLRVVAATAGLIDSSSGASMQARLWLGPGHRHAHRCRRRRLTLGDNYAKTRRFIRSCAIQARRTASVCSGSYLLAAAGVLDGKRARPRIGAAPRIHPRDPRGSPGSRRDGSVWTSAGISAGIDLSLAMIEADLGESIARHTAQQLVVYYRRPGGQSQFSALLQMEHPTAVLLRCWTTCAGIWRNRHSVRGLPTPAS